MSRQGVYRCWWVTSKAAKKVARKLRRIYGYAALIVFVLFKARWRLWQTLILSQWHPLLAQLPVESMVFTHQAEYYQAINTSTQQTDCAPFIEFMLSTISKTLAQNAPVNASVNAPVNLTHLKTPDAVLLLLTENKDMTRQQMAERIGKDVRTIGRAIAKLQQAGELTRIGSDKTGHWEIMSDD